MRDSRNNDEILLMLAQAWSARPHLRLCQLIYNAMRDDHRQLSFYDYENGDLAERLIAYCRLDVTVPGSVSRDEPLAE
jgi:uncharacterized protein with von Willebrand factor type A (vWA) domain